MAQRLSGRDRVLGFLRRIGGFQAGDVLEERSRMHESHRRTHNMRQLSDGKEFESKDTFRLIVSEVLPLA